MKTKVVVAAVALLAGLVATQQTFAQRGGRGGGMPTGDPNVPVLERGGFGPTPAEIVEFRDGIYLIRRQGFGKITVFTSDDGVLIVDTKTTMEYDTWMGLLRTVTDQPIRYVINTHFHPDHVGGNIGVESLGAAIIATDNVRKRLSATQQAGLHRPVEQQHQAAEGGSDVGQRGGIEDLGDGIVLLLGAGQAQFLEQNLGPGAGVELDR